MDLSRSVDGELLLLGQFSHTQNGDDILETLVILEDLLDGGGAVVVFVTDNVGVHDTRGRLQRVHSRVETQLGDRPGQHSRRIQLHAHVNTHFSDANRCEI